MWQLLKLFNSQFSFLDPILIIPHPDKSCKIHSVIFCFKLAASNHLLFFLLRNFSTVFVQESNLSNKVVKKITFVVLIFFQYEQASVVVWPMINFEKIRIWSHSKYLSCAQSSSAHSSGKWCPSSSHP